MSAPTEAGPEVSWSREGLHGGGVLSEERLEEAKCGERGDDDEAEATAGGEEGGEVEEGLCVAWRRVGDDQDVRVEIGDEVAALREALERQHAALGSPPAPARSPALE